MTKQEIKDILQNVQEMLDSMQNENESFMFIAAEGTRFVLKGTQSDIASQILLWMIRFDAFKDIIMLCADRYAEINIKHGDSIRNTELPHFIYEVNGKKYEL